MEEPKKAREEPEIETVHEEVSDEELQLSGSRRSGADPRCTCCKRVIHIVLPHYSTHHLRSCTVGILLEEENVFTCQNTRRRFFFLKSLLYPTIHLRNHSSLPAKPVWDPEAKFEAAARGEVYLVKNKIRFPDVALRKCASKLGKLRQESNECKETMRYKPYRYLGGDARPSHSITQR